MVSIINYEAGTEMGEKSGPSGDSSWVHVYGPGLVVWLFQPTTALGLQMTAGPYQGRKLLCHNRCACDYQ